MCIINGYYRKSKRLQLFDFLFKNILMHLSTKVLGN